MIFHHWTFRLFAAGNAIVWATYHGGPIHGMAILCLVIMYEAQVRHE
jgi:hypothetical protein